MSDDSAFDIPKCRYCNRAAAQQIEGTYLCKEHIKVKQRER